MMKKPTILLTRQKGLNETDALRFTQAGYEVSVCPLLTLSFLPIPKDVQKRLTQADWGLVQIVPSPANVKTCLADQPSNAKGFFLS